MGWWNEAQRVVKEMHLMKCGTKVKVWYLGGAKEVVAIGDIRSGDWVDLLDSKHNFSNTNYYYYPVLIQEQTSYFDPNYEEIYEEELFKAILKHDVNRIDVNKKYKQWVIDVEFVDK